MADGRSSLEAPLATFAHAVQKKLSALAAGEPEDQLRAPTEKLLEDAGIALARAVVAKGESLLPGRLGKPDYAVLVDAALAGYVELKALGAERIPTRFRRDTTRSSGAASRVFRTSSTRTGTNGRCIGMEAV